MTKFARIENGVVVELLEAEGDIKDMMHPSLHWEPCPATTVPGDLFADGAFTSYEVPLSDTKAQHIATLRMACAAAIVGGFTSDALGEMHTYPSDATAQINLMGSVMDSILPDLPQDWATPFWTADASNEWAFRPHSAQQIQQAGRDGKAHVVACQSTLEVLSAQVMAAISAEDVAAIAWPEGVGA